MKALSDFVISQIRTYVPLLVAFLFGWLADQGIILSDEASQGLVLFLSSLAGALWYLIVRLLEKYVTPKLGWLLLAPAQPAYAESSSNTLNPPKPGPVEGGGRQTPY